MDDLRETADGEVGVVVFLGDGEMWSKERCGIVGLFCSSDSITEQPILAKREADLV